MPKTVDPRTYLLLEKAFVRRLKRAWHIQSAPTYAAMAEACRNHKWDEARRLAQTLDMTEVGTENREWISYMLLSCAVFGAGMASKGKPSFVGVGSFDTFLKQVTTTFLMYLEHSGTRQVQREALQSIAEDEAKTKAIKWDEAKHPRKAKGGPKGGEFAKSTIIEASYDGYQHTLTMTTPDGQVVGSAKLRRLSHSHVVEFDILWIDPSARGKGAGEHLYRAAADKAKALGGTSLLGDVTSAGILRLGIKVLGQPELVADAINELTVEDAMKRLEPLAPENAQGIIDTGNYLAVRWPLTKKTYAVKSDLVCKWDESQHPRDKEGQFTDKSMFLRGGEDISRPMEGAGPERAKWERLNKAAMDADEASFKARDAHVQLFAKLEAKYPKDHPYTEYSDEDFAALEATRQPALDAQRAAEDAELALKAQEPAMRIEVIRNVATSVAEKMGVDPSIIDVVHQPGREFTVGNQDFTEAGHFNPATGRVQLNAAIISYGDTPSVKGITAHELSHVIYHETKKASEQEFQQYLAKAIEGNTYTAWYHERFDNDPGTHWKRLKPEYREEFARDYPATMALSALSEGQPFVGIAQSMVEEDGHSHYAKSYWAPEAKRSPGGYEAAINETMAELTRYIVSPNSWYDAPPPKDSPWVTLTRAMHEWYRQDQDAQQAHAQFSGMFR